MSCTSCNLNKNSTSNSSSNQKSYRGNVTSNTTNVNTGSNNGNRNYTSNVTSNNTRKTYFSNTNTGNNTTTTTSHNNSGNSFTSVSRTTFGNTGTSCPPGSRNTCGNNNNNTTVYGNSMHAHNNFGGQNYCNPCNTCQTPTQTSYNPCSASTTTNNTGPGNGNCNQATSADTWPPADRSTSTAGVLRMGSIYVPGDYPTLGKALASLRNDVEGYRIFLAPGEHVLSTSLSSDVKSLQIIGDLSPVKGVGYSQSLGNWAPALFYNEEYNHLEGGLAPFDLKICGNKITVTGAQNPNFKSLQNGDKLVFYRSATGAFTEHVVASACGNTVTVYDPVILTNVDGTQTCNTIPGDTMFIRPNVTLKTPKTPTNNSTANIKVTVQGDLRWSGIHFKTSPGFITGSTSSGTEIEHSVLSGNLIFIGQSDSYKPNVVTCQLTFPNNAGGTVYFATHLGEVSNLETFANSNLNYSYAIFNGAAEAVTLTNAADAAFNYTDFYNNDTAANLKGASRIDVRGARFVNNTTGIKAAQASSIVALPTREEDLEGIAPIFTSNATAIDIDFSSLSNFETIRVGNNVHDLYYDTIPVVDLQTYTSGTYGTRNSALNYELIDLVPPPF